jgi:hypothetical protein
VASELVSCGETVKKADEDMIKDNVSDKAEAPLTEDKELAPAPVKAVAEALSANATAETEEPVILRKSKRGRPSKTAKEDKKTSKDGEIKATEKKTEDSNIPAKALRPADEVREAPAGSRTGCPSDCR